LIEDLALRLAHGMLKKKRTSRSNGRSKGDESMELHTSRLRLIASPRAWVRLAVTEFEEFSRLIAAKLSASWPIDELEAGAPFVWQAMSSSPAEIGWWIWWIVVEGAEPEAIGYAGFKGPAGADGSVEITYAIDPVARRKGYVSEAVPVLLAWAFAHSAVQRVIADTTQMNIASRRVLEKNGFKLIATRQGGEILYFEKRRGEG
jgi:RimJ/RimL family protein N-acetyltransferase